MSQTVEIQIIPFSSGIRHLGQDVVLSGVRYRFEILQNERDGRYYLDIERAGLTLATSLPLVAGHNLLKTVSTVGLPPGILFVYDKDTKTPGSEGIGRDPKPTTFGDRVVLAYLAV